MTRIDAAILEALQCTAGQITFQSLGSSFSTAGKLSVTSGATYFLKCSDNVTMITGEAESYRAIADAVPNFCPSVIASGQTSDGHSFLISDYLDFATPSGKNLAQKLVDLHDTTTDKGYGFYTNTCCADTVQDNTWNKSWTSFFIKQRLEPISHLPLNASDSELANLIDKASNTCVPRLLDALRTRPALIHGDLWSGNERNGRVFDSCALFAHSEFELSIMKMFGGFTSVLAEYDKLKTLDEPVAERDDRIALYMCYHQLNHSGTGQGASYKQSAKDTLSRLIAKYQ